MAGSREDVKARLLAMFRVEAEEHLESISRDLAALGADTPADPRPLLESVFRAIHTLKGAARSVNHGDIETLCHAAESLMSRLTRGSLDFSPHMHDLLTAVSAETARLLDGSSSPGRAAELVAALDRTKPGGPRPKAEARKQPEPAPDLPRDPVPATIDTMRVSVTRLNSLAAQTEDLLIPRLTAEVRVQEAKALLESVRQVRAAHAAAGRQKPESGAPSTDVLAPALRALEGQLRRHLGNLQADYKTISTTVGGVIDGVREIRMMPASSAFAAFPRMVADLAAQQNKAIELVVTGGDLEVDRKVLDMVKDAILHLVRNAIDHGIEPIEERRTAGKPMPARLTLSVQPREGARVEIRVEDDGRGIDTDKVRAAAARARLAGADEARALSDREALDLIFRSGLSTSPIVTELSGRGLGLAIVRERVERLDGDVRVDTTRGGGTSVVLVLPMALATFRGVLVEAGGQRFLVPGDSIVRAVRLAATDADTTDAIIVVNDAAVPVARLAHVLGLPMHGDVSARQRLSALVIRWGDDQACFVVDEILGEREVVLKEFGLPLVRVRNVSAAGLLGTGEVVLILRPADLLQSLRLGVHLTYRDTASAGSASRPKVVLVVDDSITTRSMEQNLFEAAGYTVRTAIDGADAWTALRTQDVDIIVSDVDMPRMNGFELTRRVRADPKLAELPVVLVTALEAREDKERGIAVGANAYVIKSTFDQTNLLEIVGRLV